MKKLIILTIISISALLAVLCFTVFKNFIKARFYIQHMETDDRVGDMNIDRIIAALEINPGDSVADIGAGSGLFSRKFASAVAQSGKVYAVDINSELLEHIDNTSIKSGIHNIQTVLAGEKDPKLPEKVNLIFICDVLHYIDDQEKYINTASGYLNAHGRIAIISFKENWPPMANKFNEDDVAIWMKKSGLDLMSTEHFIKDHYLVIYKKKK